MAGSSMTFVYYELGDSIRKLVATWTSDDTTGAVSGTTKTIIGRLIKTVTDPSGTAAPTDNYDIDLTTDDSVNPLAACSTTSLNNRSTSATQEVYHLLTDGAAPIAMHPAVMSPVTIAITNAGNSKEGTVTIFYEYAGR